MQLLRIVSASVLLTQILALSVSAESSDTVTLDENGTLKYRQAAYVLTITRDWKVFLDDQLLADCSKQRPLDYEDMKGNEVTCTGSALSVELEDGSEVNIFGSTIDVEDPNGNDFTFSYGGSTPGTSVSSTIGSTTIKTGNTIVQTGAPGINVQTGSSTVVVDPTNINVSVPGVQTKSTTGIGGFNVSGIGGIDLNGVAGAAVKGLDMDLGTDGFVGIDGNSTQVDVQVPKVDVDTAWRSHVSQYTKGVKVDSLLKEMKVEETTAGLRVEMAGDVLFDFDSDTIRSDAAESLAKISQIIRSKLKNRVIVIGHTDSKGSNKYNQELSERRALSVIRWLDKRESIPGFYLYAQGKGELQPKAPNTKSDGSDYPQGRATNRRVEIYIQ